MRESGTSQATATAAYSKLAAQGSTNASPIAIAYVSSEAIPVRSRPRARANSESDPCTATRARVRIP
jgi:hypothetical protein